MGAGRRERLPAPHGLGLGRGEIGASRFRVSLRRGRVKLDENVAGLHRAVVSGVNGHHSARLDRLYHLDAPGRLELALRRGDDVDAPEIGEAEAGDDERADRPEEGDPHRRGGRLEDLKHGRKKLAVRRLAVAHIPQREHPRRRRLARAHHNGARRGARSHELVHAATSTGFVWRPHR